MRRELSTTRRHKITAVAAVGAVVVVVGGVVIVGPEALHRMRVERAVEDLWVVIERHVEQ